MQTVIKNSRDHYVIKIFNPTAGTITENVTLTSMVNNKLILDGTDQRVNVKQFAWSGPLASNLKIFRAAKTTPALPEVLLTEAAPENSINLDFSELGYVESTNNNQDFKFVLTSGVTCYMSVRRESGYKTTFEPEVYGIYDNPAIVDTPTNPNP